MRKIIKYIDKPLLIVTGLLFIFGIIMVFSSSNVTAYMSKAVSPYNYFIKQSLFLIVSFIFSLFLIKFNSKSYGVLSWLAIIGFSVLLVLLLLYGHQKNQAVSWFDLGFFSVQPSEFIKVISIAWIASYYDSNYKRLDRYSVVLFPLMVCGGITILIFLQPDLGTAIIYACIVGIMFFSTPVNYKIKSQILFGCFGLIFVVASVIFGTGNSVILDRQKERFDFRRPCDKLLKTGNQVCNGYIAINNGGLTGVGLGNSTQKYLYLPEPYTDFIFAIIVEELGIVTGISLIILYMFILARILIIGRKSYTIRGSLICYGVALYIFGHIAVNLLGLFGLMPMTGVPLPFMSYGGSFTLCLVAALTLVQRINFETNIRKNARKS